MKFAGDIAFEISLKNIYIYLAALNQKKQVTSSSVRCLPKLV